jgi:hypothetical protein
MNDFVASQIVNAGIVINKLRISSREKSASLIAISRKVISDGVDSV